MAEKLVGEYDIKDVFFGEKQPIGEVVGSIKYNSDGTMSVAFERKTPVGLCGRIGQAISAGTMMPILASIEYSGKYTATETTVGHHVEKSNVAKWVGTTLERNLAFKDGGVLELTTSDTPTIKLVFVKKA